MTYTKSGNSWVTSSKVFWPQSGNVTFYAFSPASNSAVTFDTSNKQLKYTAPTSQASQQDVLYAYTTSSRPSTNTVNLTFNHANAAFSVSAQLATGCTATVNVAGVKLVNIKPTNTLTVSSGSASASGTNISTDVAINSTTLTTTAQTISSAQLMLPPQSVTAWSGTSALANTYLAVTCKVQANGNYVVGSASANGTVYVPMNKTLTKGQENTVNLIFGSEVDNGRAYGRDENGNRITVSNYRYAGFENPVDLGLSVLWGDRDLTYPIGEYFNWGQSQTIVTNKKEYRYTVAMNNGLTNQGSGEGTTGKIDRGGSDDDYYDFNWEHTPFYIGDANGNNRNNASSWSKYTTAGQSLELSDDIVHILLGGKWRMPTEAEWQELIDNCRWVYNQAKGSFQQAAATTSNYEVYGKKDGYTDKRLNFSVGGYVDELSKEESSWIDQGVNYVTIENHPQSRTYWYVYTGNAYYWTSTMSSSPSQARGVRLRSVGNYDKRLGFRIRPVCDK